MVRNWQRKGKGGISSYELWIMNFELSLRSPNTTKSYLKVNFLLDLFAYVQATPLRRVAMLYLRGHRPRYARPPRSYCHPTQPKYSQILPKSKLFARFVCICAYFFGPLHVNCVLWVIISYRQESIVLRLSKAWWGSKHWRRHCVMLYVPTI